MTTYEMGLFSSLLDVNWEINNGNYNSTVKKALINQYSKIVDQLEDSMGSDAWKDFLSTGRKMFAPKGGYGDESVEETERMMESVR